MSGCAVQRAVLRVSIRPGAGEATVLTHVQLLPALPVSVAGRLPMHLGEMSFQGASLCESFPTSATAEWPYSCRDEQRRPWPYISCRSPSWAH